MKRENELVCTLCGEFYEDEGGVGELCPECREPGWTPGEWIGRKNINAHGQGLVYASVGDGRNIAVCYDSRDVGIIAAAPKMAALLRRMVGWTEQAPACGERGNLIEAIRNLEKLGREAYSLLRDIQESTTEGEE